MREKDITEKTLESYNDVFADMLNVLLFKGKRLVKEKDLQEVSPFSVLKVDGNIHEEIRDVAKIWRDSGVRIAFYGIENQTSVDSDMPLRVIAYDGAAYKQQLADGNSKLKKTCKKRYPVVTLVLYFGEKPWNKPKTLLESLKIPAALRFFVNDYRVNLFEIAYLTREQIDMFEGDFKVVADYFVQKRKNQKYTPSKQVIRHVDEVLQLLRVISGDARFDLGGKFTAFKKGEPITMCRILDEVENRGIEKGIKKGMEKGKLEILADLVRDNVMSMKEAAERIGMTVAKFKLALKTSE